MKFSHLDATGTARMVDVSAKPVTRRSATAEAVIRLDPRTIEAIGNAALAKGDVLTVAKVAGINAAKHNGTVIPLCHPLTLDHIEIAFDVADDHITITSTVICTGRTGAEMEALAAATGAALGIYDMCKAVDRSMEIVLVKLLEKRKEPLA